MKAIGLPLLLVAILASQAPHHVDASSLADSVQPLYRAMENFLDLIQPPDKPFLLTVVAPLFLNGSFDASKLIKSDWSQTARFYTQGMLGYTILLCIGIFLIIVVPIAGCCVCCCRCCCRKCGGRLSYTERKRAKCNRAVYGSLKLVFTTAMLFGAVLALISNQLLRSELAPSRPSESALGGLSSAVGDLADILDAVPRLGREATPRLVSEAVDNLRPDLNGTLIRLETELKHGSAFNASIALDSATGALNDLRNVQIRLATLVAGNDNYTRSLTALNNTMSDVRNNLTNPTNFTCPTDASTTDCDLLREALPHLRLSQNPGEAGGAKLGELNDRLVRLNVTQMKALVDGARAALNNISNAGMDLMNNYLSEAQNSVNDSQLMKLWDQLEDPLSNLTTLIRQHGNLSNMVIFNPLTGSSETLGDTVAAFDVYRFYAYIGLACFALLLVVLFYFGLLYGCAGEPPYEDSNCCNRGVGANFLLAGAGLGYLFYALVMIIVMLLFLTGGLMDTEACRYLTGRAGTDGYRLLDDVTIQAMHRFGNPYNISTYTNRPVTALLGGCSGGSLADAVNTDAIFAALRLKSLIDEFLNNTKDNLAKRGSDFMSGSSLNITELADVKRQAENASSVDFSGFQAELNKSLATGNLSVVLSALSNISRDTTNASEKVRFGALHTDLNNALNLATADTKVQLTRLYDLAPAIAALNVSATIAPDRLEAAGAALSSASLLRAAIDRADNGLSGRILNESRTALTQLLTSSLDCARLSASLHQLVGVPCVRLLRPLNGYWAGLGFCLICLLPCLILAIKLANLYRKTEKYKLKDMNPKPV